MTAKEEHAPVVVVGAGPAGLTAAIALARGGTETLLLERRAHTSRAPRANVVSTSTMELMRSWGLEERVRERLGEPGLELDLEVALANPLFESPRAHQLHRRRADHIRPRHPRRVGPALQQQRLYSRAREGDCGGEPGGACADYDHRDVLFLGFHASPFIRRPVGRNARYHSSDNPSSE